MHEVTRCQSRLERGARVILLCTVVVMAAAPSAWTAEWTAETEPMLAPNEARDAEYYFPLEWAPCYYNKDAITANDDICLRRIDQHTGAFIEVADHRNDPNCIVLLENAGPKGPQGPELARDSNGLYVLFNRLVDGRSEVWRTTPFGLDPTATVIEVQKVASLPNEHLMQVMHSRGHALDRVGVLLRSDNGMQYGLLDEVEADASALKDLPYRRRGDKGRWLPGQLRFAYVGEVSDGNRQLVVVDAESGSSQVISDPTVLRNYETATPFRAPEYGDEVLIAGTAEDELAIFRDTGKEHWEEIAVLSSPVPSMPYLDGVEVIERDAANAPSVGGIGWSTAYLTAWARDGLTDPTMSSIVLWSLDGTVAKRFDSGHEGGVAKYDPELVIGRDDTSATDRIFIHFISRDLDSKLRQLYLGQTGLSFPRQVPVADSQDGAHSQ